MTYASKKDWMVNNHCAEYQDEVLLGEQMNRLIHRIDTKMPFGYPLQVYHPRTPKHRLQKTRFIHRPGGILSNGVPKVLGSEIIEGYLLGLYNPEAHT